MTFKEKLASMQNKSRNFSPHKKSSSSKASSKSPPLRRMSQKMNFLENKSPKKQWLQIFKQVSKNPSKIQKQGSEDLMSFQSIRPERMLYP